MTVGEAFRRAFGSYRSALWAGLACDVALVLGLLLLVVPGVLVGVYWFFAFQIIAAHKTSGWQSLRQSERFVKGRWRTLFGRIASFLLLLLLGVLTLSAPAAFLPENIGLDVLTLVPVNLLIAYGLVWFTMLYLLSAPEPVAAEPDTGVAATC